MNTKTKELTHTLTGTDAATAMILEAVQQKFFDDNDSFGRTEFYIAQAMCSDACASYEVERSKIVGIVNAMHGNYLDNCEGHNKGRINSAFRKLVRAGFFYSTTGFEGPTGYKTRKRYYALNQGKYTGNG